MNNPILQIQGLRTSFFTDDEEIPAVDHIDFHINEGEILGIVGESGCGKSVTSLSIMGLIPKPPGKIVGGKILYNGEDLCQASEKRMREIRGNDIAMIFQEPMTSLNPVFTIGNQLIEAIKIHNKNWSKKQAYNRAVEILKLVGLPRAEELMNEYPHQLSGGMRQRVMIAMAMVCNPKVLIADEPTTALDVTIQAQILELMMELKEKIGMSIIMITHDLGIVANMCEKIAVMYAGKIVEFGKTDDIFYTPRHEYTKGLLQSIPKLNDKEHKKLVPIEGTPVDLLNPPKGCPFAPRCNSCMRICLNKMPEYTIINDNHYSACWLLQKKEFEQGGDKGE